MREVEELVEGEGGVEGEGENVDGHFPGLLYVSRKSLRVCVQAAPPVPDVTPRNAVGEPLRVSLRFTRKSCRKATSVGDSVDMYIAQPQAS